MIDFLVGGARSGKSTLALALAERHGGAVTYVATSPRIEGDDDLDARIEAHRRERPAEWSTVEEELDLVGAIAGAPGGALVVVDCITLWVNNVVWRGDDDESVLAATDAAVRAAAGRRDPVVVVSNEVGLGIVPADTASRRFRDLLGRVNQRWAAAADRTVLLVAGRALPLHDPIAVLA